MDVQSIKHQAEKLLLLLNNLPNGKKYKDVAKLFNLSTSRVTNLKNKVLPFIIKTELKELNEISDYIRDEGINLRQKIYKDFSIFIEELELFESKEINDTLINKKSIVSIWKRGLYNSIENSKKVIKTWDILGFYYSYTYSSFNNAIMRKPVLIRENKFNGDIEVFFGNKKSRFRYVGIAHVTGSHALYMHLIDFPDNIQEVLLIVVSMPFNQEVTFLRGVNCCVDSSRQPFGRRIVFLRKSNVIKLEEFEEIEQEYFSRENGYRDDDERKICEYLYDERFSNLRFTETREYMFGLDNLLYEKQWLEERNKKFPLEKVDLEKINQRVKEQKLKDDYLI